MSLSSLMNAVGECILGLRFFFRQNKNKIIKRFHFVIFFMSVILRDINQSVRDFCFQESIRNSFLVSLIENSSQFIFSWHLK